MNFEIFVEEDNDNLVFSPSLPLEFSTFNMDARMKYDNKILLSAKENDIDFVKLYNNIIETKNEIMKDFKIKYKEPFEIEFYINTLYCKKTGYDFIKHHKDLNVTIFTHDFNNLINIFRDDEYPNLKIKFKNSDDVIAYKEFYNMYNKLNEIVEFVKHYNLTPLEQTMLVYDIVKSNKYNAEKNGESYKVSRNLNRIISNDKIVCVGFANLMDFILNNLNIESNTVSYIYEDKTDVGHERNYLYLKDDKYNIDGVFFLDATWDSKKDNKYLDNYLFFLRPFKDFKTFSKNEKVNEPMKFELLEESDNEINSKIEKNNFQTLGYICMLNNELNREKIILPQLLTKNIAQKKELTKNILSFYNKRIKKDAFKNALYKVRKIEYINGIIDKPLNEFDIDVICDKYFKESAEIKLLKAINAYKEPTLEKDLKEAKAKNVKEDLLRMELLKALKVNLNDLPKNDYIKKM